MKNRKCIILSIGVTLVICGMLCSSFFSRYSMFDNYFLLFPVSLGICLVTIMALLSFLIKRNVFKISILDVLIFVLVVYYIARYDYELQLANWKIVYAVLLLILWYALRILLTNATISRTILFGGIVTIGCILSIWGLLQLYGLQPSNHSLFAITGPFYNPGPYSGYLAMIFPISLGCLLQSTGKIRYLWLVAFSLMLCILPAGMSRSAWLALFFSSLWLLAIHFRWIITIKSYLQGHRYIVILCCILLTVIVACTSALLFRMKADSANGRLFIWKTTCKAIVGKPLFGYGPGTFPRVYGDMQSTYFALGNYTELEERVAGSPEYAFNEYLQMCVEGGAILLILLLVVAFGGIRQGVYNKEYTVCSGMISLLIFSFSSYPFQLLPFLMLGVVLMALCVSIKNTSSISKQKNSLSYLFLAIIIVSANIVISIYLCEVQKKNK